MDLCFLSLKKVKKSPTFKLSNIYKPLQVNNLRLNTTLSDGKPVFCSSHMQVRTFFRSWVVALFKLNMMRLTRIVLDISVAQSIVHDSTKKLSTTSLFLSLCVAWNSVLVYNSVIYTKNLCSKSSYDEFSFQQTFRYEALKIVKPLGLKVWLQNRPQGQLIHHEPIS